MNRAAVRRNVWIGAVLVVGSAVALQPGALVAAWREIRDLVALQGAPVPASPAVLSAHEIERLDTTEPQAQAGLLLERAINHYEGASAEIERRVDGWRGKLHMDPPLEARYLTAMDSNDLRVRAAAIEVYLAVYGAAKIPETVDRMIAAADGDENDRTGSFWVLGLLANRGVERDRILRYLERWLDDANDATRQWAVESLAVVGDERAIPVLLRSFHDDPSGVVRERAACGLAQSGMFTEEQRWGAVPELLRFMDDPALDAQTRRWAFQALRDITGQQQPNDAAAWRDWWGSRRRAR